MSLMQHLWCELTRSLQMVEEGTLLHSLRLMRVQKHDVFVIIGMA